MMRIILCALFLTIAAFSYGIQPQFWDESTQQAFADGDPQSVSITSDGELVLSPQLKKIYGGTESIIWKIVEDSKGNVYAATGNEGKVLKIDTAGKATTVLDTKELEVQAMIVGKNDEIFRTF